MSTTIQLIHQLETQRSQAERELEKLNLAIEALTAIEGTPALPVHRKRKFSKAGLARIAAAQRKRWAKIKAAQQKSPL
jgi:hypothetical protein